MLLYHIQLYASNSLTDITPDDKLISSNISLHSKKSHLIRFICSRYNTHVPMPSITNHNTIITNLTARKPVSNINDCINGILKEQVIDGIPFKYEYLLLKKVSIINQTSATTKLQKYKSKINFLKEENAMLKRRIRLLKQELEEMDSYGSDTDSYFAYDDMSDYDDALD